MISNRGIVTDAPDYRHTGIASVQLWGCRYMKKDHIVFQRRVENEIAILQNTL